MINLEVGSRPIPDYIRNASTGSLYADLAFGCNAQDVAMIHEELERREKEEKEEKEEKNA